MWTVSRQRQWPDGKCVVEISSGGRDYANPDGLVPRYPGEFEEYQDPREAVKVAVEIAREWQKDTPKEVILIDHGATGGFSMPFDGMEPSGENLRVLQEWAEAEYEILEKCDRCGAVLPVDRRGKPEFWYPCDAGPDFGKFCSEQCCELAWHEEAA
ncbi:MAG: hypothetical protein AMXMBFR13_06930 [Phycisphaerae bacterium]